MKTVLNSGKHNFIFILLVLSIFSIKVYSNSRFEFSTDYTLFKYGGKYILEVYCSFYQKGLKYEYANGTYEAAGLIDLIITNKSTNEVFYSVLNKVPTNTNDTSGANLYKRLVVQKNVPIVPGEYKLKATGKDFNDTAIYGTINLEFVIPELNSAPMLSGIEISSHVAKSSDTSSYFYKYGIEVVPNPSLMFGMNLNSIYYYYEIYGFNQDIISSAFTINTTLENDKREIVRKIEKQPKKFSETMLDFGSFSLDNMPTGAYYMVTNISDTLKSHNLKQEKKFFIYSDKTFTDTTSFADASFLKSEYATMKEEQVLDEYSKSIYLRKDEETKYFESLKTLDEKRNYLFNFWKKRDNDPNTPLNEFKRDYMIKVSQANLSFKQSFTEGWKTDRGRIYIIYGKPSDIERFPYEAETKSYEIWHFDDIQGGAICVFIEKVSGSGTYEIVHSTIRNELRDDNWKIQLKK
jgi:GWxTD domain-containing protein